MIDQAVSEAVADGSLKKIETTLISTEAYDELKDRIVEAITVHHKREPLSRGLSKELLRERFFSGGPAETFRDVIGQLERDGAFVADKEVVHLRGHTRELSADDARLRDKLEKIYRDAGVAPPSLAEAFAQAGVNSSPHRGRPILQLLLDSGVLFRVHGDMIFHRAALNDLIAKIRSHAKTRADRSIDVGAFKELAGISRKYAIPLLEHFDRTRVTRREGDRRVIL